MPTPKERDAIASLTNAKAHMEALLNRNVRLERTLSTLIKNHCSVKAFVPEDAYRYKSDIRVHEFIDDQAAEAEKVL